MPPRICTKIETKSFLQNRFSSFIKAACTILVSSTMLQCGKSVENSRKATGSGDLIKQDGNSLALTFNLLSDSEAQPPTVKSATLKIVCTGGKSTRGQVFEMNSMNASVSEVFKDVKDSYEKCAVDPSSIQLSIQPVMAGGAISREKIHKCTFDATKGIRTIVNPKVRSNQIIAGKPTISQAQAFQHNCGTTGTATTNQTRTFIVAKNIPSSMMKGSMSLSGEKIEIVIDEVDMSKGDSTSIIGDITDSTGNYIIPVNMFPFAITAFGRSSNGASSTASAATTIRCVDLVDAGFEIDSIKLPPSDINIQRRNPWCTNIALKHVRVAAVSCSNVNPSSAINIPIGEILNPENLQKMTFHPVTEANNLVTWINPENVADSDRNKFQKPVPFSGNPDGKSCVVLATPQKAPDDSTITPGSLFNGDYVFAVGQFGQEIPEPSTCYDGLDAILLGKSEFEFSRIDFNSATVAGPIQPSVANGIWSETILPDRIEGNLTRTHLRGASIVTAYEGACSRRALKIATDDSPDKENLPYGLNITLGDAARQKFRDIFRETFNGESPEGLTLGLMHKRLDLPDAPDPVTTSVIQEIFSFGGANSDGVESTSRVYWRLDSGQSIRKICLEIANGGELCSGFTKTNTDGEISDLNQEKAFVAIRFQRAKNESDVGLSILINGQPAYLEGPTYELQRRIPLETAAAIAQSLKRMTIGSDAAARRATPGEFNAWFAVGVPVSDGAMLTTVMPAIDSRLIPVSGYPISDRVARLSVNVDSVGGTVSGIGGETCTPNSTLAKDFAINTQVTLTANPEPGYDFSGWGGACSGMNPICSVTMDANKTVTANFTTDKYTLALSKTGTGSGTLVTAVNGTATTATAFDHGTVVTITATADASSTFNGFTGCTVTPPSTTTCNITMDQNRTVSGDFSLKSYTLTTSVTGTGTVTRAPDAASYTHGSVVTLTVNPGTGRNFSGWGGACSGMNPTCSVTMDANKTVTANFTTNKYTLALSKTGAGSGTLATSVDGTTTTTTAFDHGTVVTITATADASSTFNGFTGCTVTPPSTTTCNITMDQNRTVSGDFSLKSYTLTTSVTGTGTVTRAPDAASYTHGSVVTLTANPGTGRNFSGWGGACSGTNPTCSVTMDANKTVTANFTTNKYTLALSKTGAGSGTLVTSVNGTATTDTAFDYNTVVTITATADASSTFNGFTGCTVTPPSTTTCNITMDQNLTVSGEFSLKSYTLTTNVDGAGTITRAPDAASYPHGSVVTLTANPGTGQNFSGWGGACSGTNPTCSVTMDANKTVTANFTTNKYTLALSKSGAGSGTLVTSVSGAATTATEFDYNTVVTITATADASSTFNGFTGCTVTPPSTTTCNITMDQNRTVSGDFSLKAYTLTTNITGTGTVTRAPDAASYTHGSVVTLTANPGTGRSFSGWGGACSGMNQTCSVTMDSSKTVTANFTTNKYTLALSKTGAGSGTLVTSVNGTATTDTAFDYNTVVTITATADASSTFNGFTGCTVTPPSTTTCNITMDQNRTVSGDFSLKAYTLTTNITGTGTVTRAPDAASYTHGSVVTLTANPGTGRSFSGWGGACSGMNQTCSVTMDANKTVTANFTTNKYTLALSKSGAGSGTLVTSVSGAATTATEFDYNTVVTITATADASSTFNGFTGCTVTPPSTTTCNITMDQNRTVSGDFSLKAYTLTTNITGTGTVTRAPDAASYTHGSVVTLTANPGTGRSFSGWGGACSGMNQTCSVTMDSSKTVTANFTTNKYTLALSKTGAGSGTLVTSVNGTATTDTAFDYNTVVTITATADASSTFNGFTGCTVTPPSTTTCNITMDQNRTVSGDFSLKAYTLTTNITGTGTVTRAPDAASYTHGSVVTLTANPGTGRSFSGWGGACSGMNQTCSVTMDANKTVTANFTTNKYTLALSKSGAGSGTLVTSVSGAATTATEFDYNTVVTITATADASSTFNGFTGCTVTPPSTTTCNITMDQNRTVSGDFSLKAYTLTTNITGTGTVTRAPDAASYTHGSVVTLTANPGTGRSFSGWGGACSGMNQTCSVTMDSSKTVTANFTTNKYTLALSKTGAGSGTLVTSVNGTATTDTAFDYNTVVTITATADASSTFNGFTGCTVTPPSTTTCNITMDQNRTVSGDFSLKAYTLTTNITGTGTVTRAPDAASYTHGSVVTLTANPGTGRSFSGWGGACSGMNQTCSVTMDANKTVTANFTTNKYTLALSKSGAGSGTLVTSVSGAATTATEFDYNTVVTITATADASSTFNGFTGCTVTPPSTTTCNITMDQNRTVSGDFSLKAYTLTTNITGTGTVTRAPDAASYTHGSVVTLTANPGTGRSFSGWGGACSGMNQTCSVTMDSSKTVTANFTTNKYTLALSKTGAGSGTLVTSVNGTATTDTAFDYNTVVTITATADASSTFNGFTGCTVTPPSTTTCNITMDQNRTVSGDFSLKAYTLTTNITGTGTVTRAPDAASYTHGTTVTLTATPGSGYSFNRWGDGPCANSTLTNCQILMDATKSQLAIFEGLNSLTLRKIDIGAATIEVTKVPAGDFAPQAHSWSFKEAKTISTAVPASSTMELRVTATVPNFFAGWSGSCAGTQSTVCRVTMETAKSVVASVTTWHNKMLRQDVNDDGQVDVNDLSIVQTELERYGTHQLAMPDISKAFIDVTGDGWVSPLDLLNIINWLDANRKTLTLQPTDGGVPVVTSVQPSSETGATNGYAIGTRVTVIANPSVGYRFEGWSSPPECIPVTADTCEITMSDHKTASARFSIRTHSLTVASTGGGIVTKSPSAVTYNHGTTVTLTAIPEAGQKLQSWGGACSGTAKTCTITVTGDTQVTAAFVANELNYNTNCDMQGNSPFAWACRTFVETQTTKTVRAKITNLTTGCMLSGEKNCFTGGSESGKGGDGQIRPAIRMALPNTTIWQQVEARGLPVYAKLTTQYLCGYDRKSTTRNGFTSGQHYDSCWSLYGRIDELVWFDGIQWVYTNPWLGDFTPKRYPNQ